jgi:hypothetical protein
MMKNTRNLRKTTNKFSSTEIIIIESSDDELQQEQTRTYNKRKSTRSNNSKNNKSSNSTMNTRRINGKIKKNPLATSESKDPSEQSGNESVKENMMAPYYLMRKRDRKNYGTRKTPLRHAKTKLTNKKTSEIDLDESCDEMSNNAKKMTYVQQNLVQSENNLTNSKQLEFGSLHRRVPLKTSLRRRAKEKLNRSYKETSESDTNHGRKETSESGSGHSLKETSENDSDDTLDEHTDTNDETPDDLYNEEKNRCLQVPLKTSPRRRAKEKLNRSYKETSENDSDDESIDNGTSEKKHSRMALKRLPRRSAKEKLNRSYKETSENDSDGACNVEGKKSEEKVSENKLKSKQKPNENSCIDEIAVESSFKAADREILSRPTTRSCSKRKANRSSNNDRTYKSENAIQTRNDEKQKFKQSFDENKKSQNSLDVVFIIDSDSEHDMSLRMKTRRSCTSSAVSKKTLSKGGRSRRVKKA